MPYFVRFFPFFLSMLPLPFLRFLLFSDCRAVLFSPVCPSLPLFPFMSVVPLFEVLLLAHVLVPSPPFLSALPSPSCCFLVLPDSTEFTASPFFFIELALFLLFCFNFFPTVCQAAVRDLALSFAVKCSTAAFPSLFRLPLLFPFSFFNPSTIVALLVLSFVSFTFSFLPAIRPPSF